MKPLSDKLVAQLREEMQVPDLSGTRYKILRYLARGGMGSVWLAEDTVLNRRIALKVLDVAAPAGAFEERLLQEARILALLEHPGIVPVHDAGTLADGRTFYCMKYVEGETLRQHVSGRSLPEKLRLLERIAEPLEFAHARGFIHRDLKPENIMIGAFGEVLVMDWGLARICGSHGIRGEDKSGDMPSTLHAPPKATGEGSVLGTPGYMAPEQGGGGAVDKRADIFSLGAILWFMMTGSLPGEPSAAAIPRPLRGICDKAMAADPSGRYCTVKEMIADLSRYLNGSPVEAFAENFFERAMRIYRRHRTAVVLIAAYLFMRLLFIVMSRR